MTEAEFQKRAASELACDKFFTCTEFEAEEGMVTARVTMGNRSVLVMKLHGHEAYISLIIDYEARDVSVHAELCNGETLFIRIPDEQFPMDEDTANREAHNLAVRALKIAKATKHARDEKH